MTDQITISLSNVHNVKKVYIEDLDHTFKVRKLGAGEELDLSEKLRRLNAIIIELNSIDYDELSKEKPTKADKDNLAKVEKRSAKLFDEVSLIKRFELKTYKRAFDDGVGGKKTDELFNSLTDEGRATLFEQIFNPIVLPEPAEESIEETS